MADDGKSKETKKKKVLSLLEEDQAPKKSRRERQREKQAAAEAAEPTVEQQKKGALDLGIGDDDAPKSAIKKTRKSGKDILAPISKIKADAELTPTEKAAREEVKEEEAAVPVEAAGEESPAADDKRITLKPPIIVEELAERMGLKGFEIMKDLIALEVFVSPKQAIEPEIAEKVCEAHGFVFEREKREKGGGVHKVEEVIEEPEPEEEEPEDKMVLRAPIITFMGHVDHGKTSLLDYLRQSRVTSGEAGGITQHVGAYQVDHGDRSVTFIDTPGHAVFSSMRARGADVTDIIVLVIAADDGIMPQTREAISHAKAADKTIIVAINKCDLPAADPTRVKTQLMEHELTPVDFGGDIDCLEVSASTGQGMDELLELMALQAEVLELKANPRANARAIVIESQIQAGKGATATVIVENGTLKVGQPFICGPYSGKVKSLINDRGEQVQEVLPGCPVEVLGFSEAPHVGDELVEMESERAAKKLSDERLHERRQERLVRPKKSRMEDMLSFVQTGEKTTLNLILRADVQGSVQAIQQAVEEIESDKVNVKFLHAATGAISESDILLASSSDAVVLGFNTKVESKAVKVAKAEDVQIKLYSVIYELLDQVREAMLGLLVPETREKILGHAEVKQVFKVKRGRAAGCLVTNGKVTRTAHARVMRDRTPVYDGKMSTLRRFTDEVEEVKQGIECGIRLGSFNEYEEGDIIECYNIETLPVEL
ncbi:translation initiation factor IF-2 [Roseibacillus ishigakijimensis]|uniref:Translation initiation factor IF-2 n=1 Tax=Roseibacillus ishigakijimensis TaxID=454146 RepID=A0A934VKQ2_9BACT|nr:translation initiation factor IF-2 [Roseibacillus ishigakijimensis]MBK1833884.1 translation initiation factor IF-2 [Roseibacillus ishigakijimensis]